MKYQISVFEDFLPEATVATWRFPSRNFPEGFEFYLDGAVVKLDDGSQQFVVSPQPGMTVVLVLEDDAAKAFRKRYPKLLRMFCPFEGYSYILVPYHRCDELLGTSHWRLCDTVTQQEEKVRDEISVRLNGRDYIVEEWDSETGKVRRIPCEP
jgi:hypothetical protein